MNRNSTMFNIVAVISIVLGIICCLTIFGAVAGVPLIIGGTKYNKFGKLTDEACLAQKDSITVWAVVIAIFSFPIGLLALIPFFNLQGDLSNAAHNVTKSNMDKKEEQIKKLIEMRENGLITEEELAAAKMKILTE